MDIEASGLDPFLLRWIGWDIYIYTYLLCIEDAVIEANFI